jgi:hypothetical protein
MRLQSGCETQSSEEGPKAAGDCRSRLVEDKAMTLAAKSYWTRMKV